MSTGNFRHLNVIVGSEIKLSSHRRYSLLYPALLSISRLMEHVLHSLQGTLPYMSNWQKTRNHFPFSCTVECVFHDAFAKDLSTEATYIFFRKKFVYSMKLQRLLL